MKQQCVENNQLISPWTKWPPLWQTTISNAFSSIPIWISQKFVPRAPVDNKPALVQIMAWCWTADKPLPELMLTNSLTHIFGTRGRWVNRKNLPLANNYDEDSWNGWKNLCHHDDCRCPGAKQVSNHQQSPWLLWLFIYMASYYAICMVFHISLQWNLNLNTKLEDWPTCQDLCYWIVCFLTAITLYDCQVQYGPIL